MSPLPGTYSFLPWLRQGLANQIVAAPGPGSARAAIEVALEIEGQSLDGGVLTQPVTRRVPLYGPGDIVAIDRKAIIRTEPGPGTTNFEANYLPFIEFYDEDFPWRYTPEVPAGGRLRPWLTLVVLTEDEFTDGGQTADRPLPFISVDGAEALFPPWEQLWAWAHVHVNRDLGATPDEIVSGDMTAVLPRLGAVLSEDPDLAYSRLVCPRRLDISTTYHAFVLPTFESGRLAGLGLDPAASPGAQHAAWQPSPGRQEPTFFPYYHRWTFITATTGDFEYLVRLLEPRPVDSRVGRRDIDVQEPGSNLRGITDPELAGVLRLGGALRVPLLALSDEERADHERYDSWDEPGYPRPFQQDMAAFINLSDDYATTSAADANADSDYDATVPDPADPSTGVPDPDPLITPPLYGRWHSLSRRLLTARDGSAISPDRNWVHQLNLDPRHRVAAAYGTEVIQRGQEQYMDAAWEQIGDVLEANRRIRRGQLATFAAASWYAHTMLPLLRRAEARAMMVTAPVLARVMADGRTVRQRVTESAVPRALISTQTRRMLRPTGRLMKALAFDATVTPENLIERVAAGELPASPPKAPLEGAPTLDDLADDVEPARPSPPAWAAWLLVNFPSIIIALVGIAVILVIIGILTLPFGVVLVAAAAGAGWLAVRFRRWRRLMEPIPGLREEQMTPDVVDDLPHSSDFRIILDPADAFRPTLTGSDSPEAVRFKDALRDAYTAVSASNEAAADLRPTLWPLDVTATARVLVTSIDPEVTVPRHTRSAIAIPSRVRDQIGEGFVEAMAYPEIDTPMYRPLVELSEEHLIPNLQFIEQNTISLLETNQVFIEAYMVGLNHEFARELLWREYPTDQRASSFRQFWDPSGYLDDAGDTIAALRERLKDIPPLHRWPRSSELGEHDHRETGGEDEEEVVLVIRGELLKRYPNAVIYAHRARWQRSEDGSINRQVPRELDDAELGEATNPPRNRVKTPLYEAKVEPDITFFGFDLTVEEAVGGEETEDEPDPGWFFVIKERPGEPRFGLDLGASPSIHVWNDLGWQNVSPGIQPGDTLEIAPAMPTITLTPPPPTADPQIAVQATDDQAVRWHAGMDAAELAYILYQVPVLVAVHSAEMLPRR